MAQTQILCQNKRQASRFFCSKEELVHFFGFCCFLFLRWEEKTLGKTEGPCSFVFGMYNLYGGGGGGRGVGGVFGLIEVCDGLAQQQGALCQAHFTTGGDRSPTRTCGCAWREVVGGNYQVSSIQSLLLEPSDGAGQQRRLGSKRGSFIGWQVVGGAGGGGAHFGTMTPVSRVCH